MANDSMFPNMRFWPSEGDDSDFAPIPESVIRNERIKISIKQIHVATYDLSKPKDVSAYIKSLKELYDKMNTGLALRTVFDLRFVDDGENSKWLVHTEWIEYEKTGGRVDVKSS